MPAHQYGSEISGLSCSANASQRQKRQRNGDVSHTGSASRKQRTASPDPMAEPEYDLDQSVDERRKVQRRLRALNQEVNDRRDEYLQPNSDVIQQALNTANQLEPHVKQTGEAAIDSRLLVNLAELIDRKTQNLTKGSFAQGLDLDEFLSKSIRYMQEGHGLEENADMLSSTQRRRRVTEDVGDDGDALHWAHYGRFAVMPFLSKGPTTAFLIGPMGVEKKARKLTQRVARFRPNDLQEMRPEVIEKEALGHNTKNDLTTMCSRILDRLSAYQEECQSRIGKMDEQDESREAMDSVMDAMGLFPAGDINLLKFAINPRSFGQTVENLFYISFLVRDKKVEVDMSPDGFASIG